MIPALVLSPVLLRILVAVAVSIGLWALQANFVAPLFDDLGVWFVGTVAPPGLFDNHIFKYIWELFEFRVLFSRLFSLVSLFGVLRLIRLFYLPVRVLLKTL